MQNNLLQLMKSALCCIKYECIKCPYLGKGDHCHDVLIEDIESYLNELENEKKEVGI